MDYTQLLAQCDIKQAQIEALQARVAELEGRAVPLTEWQVLTAERDAFAAKLAALEGQDKEPVAYEFRMRADWIADWGLWSPCNKEQHEMYIRVPKLHDWHYETRALYLAAGAQAQPLSLEQIRKWWASENGLEDIDMCKLNDFTEVVRAVLVFAAKERT